MNRPLRQPPSDLTARHRLAGDARARAIANETINTVARVCDDRRDDAMDLGIQDREATVVAGAGAMTGLCTFLMLHARDRSSEAMRRNLHDQLDASLDIAIKLVDATERDPEAVK